MKITLLLIASFSLFIHSHGQSKSEADVLSLSKKIFIWETENRIDSIEKIFDEKFVVVNGAGESQTKKQYITTLQSGNFTHNNIDIEENLATVKNNTATVIGKGKFTVTNSGKKVTLSLSYIEVFTRVNKKDNWKVLAMHATVLQH